MPDLGTFTSLDTVSGSAQNPLSLNRYLYAEADPATLVNTDGHCASSDGWNGCYSNERETIGSGDMSTDVYNYQHQSRADGRARPTWVPPSTTSLSTHPTPRITTVAAAAPAAGWQRRHWRRHPDPNVSYHLPQYRHGRLDWCFHLEITTGFITRGR